MQIRLYHQRCYTSNSNPSFQYYLNDINDSMEDEEFEEEEDEDDDGIEEEGEEDEEEDEGEA